MSRDKGLFQSSLDRNAVERALKERPQPEGCSLHVDDADQLVTEAEEALEKAKSVVRSALVNMASLLRQPALRSLFELERVIHGSACSLPAAIHDLSQGRTTIAGTRTLSSLEAINERLKVLAASPWPASGV